MTKTYQHSFATGLVLTLVVKFEKDQLTFHRSHSLITREEADEYERWRD